MSCIALQSYRGLSHRSANCQAVVAAAGAARPDHIINCLVIKDVYDIVLSTVARFQKVRGGSAAVVPVSIPARHSTGRLRPRMRTQCIRKEPYEHIPTFIAHWVVSTHGAAHSALMSANRHPHSIRNKMPVRPQRCAIASS